LLDEQARFMSTIAERRLQKQALWCAEIASELEFELPAPQICLDIPNKDLGLDNAGRLAELVILFHYLLRHPHGILTDSILIGEHPLDPRVHRTIAQFFGFERARAKFVDCECSKKNTTLKFEDTLNTRPDLLDVSRRQFYEVKPDNQPGIDDGMDKVNFDRCLLDCLWDNRFLLRITTDRLSGRIAPETKFEPPKEQLIFQGAGEAGMVRVLIRMRRAGPGLMVYKFCAEGKISAKVLQQIRNWIEQWKRNLKRLLEEILRLPPPPPVPALLDFKRAQQIAKQFPGTVPTDVFTEVANRLINVQKLWVFGLALLLAPAIIYVGVRFAPALFARLVTLAGSLMAYLGRLSLASAFMGRLGLQFSMAAAMAAQADAAANEARNATSPAQRKAAVVRASRAASEAAAARRTAAMIKTKIDQQLKGLDAAQAKVLKDAKAVVDQIARAGAPADSQQTVRDAAERLAKSAQENTRAAAALGGMAKEVEGRTTGAAQSAAQSARSVGGRADVPVGPGCDSVVAGITKMYKFWLRNPRRDEVTLDSSPVQELPGGATRFEIVNESGYQATVLVGPPTCKPVVLPKGATQSLDVVPEKPHQIAAHITDSHVNVPLFPSYGQQTFRFGWLHRMHLRPVRIEPQR